MSRANSIRAELDMLKKERIRDRAEQLFYERGFSGTTMEAIADSLRATKPFLYGSYAKKTDILVDIHMSVVDRILQALAAARASSGTPSEKLRRFARELTEMTLNNQAAVAIYFREEASLPPRQLHKINDAKGRIDEGLAALLAEGVAAGEFRVADVRLAALAIGGMISWAYTWYRAAGRLDIPAIADRMAEYALRVAGAPPQ
jgi:TetR/AcrR family transcriptional regulator, cholesterol catabolism regulator